MVVEAYYNDERAKVRIKDYHTNIVLIEKYQEILFEKKEEMVKKTRTDRSLLSMVAIYDFAECLDVQDVEEVLNKQIEYNCAISEEGLKGNYGANIGKCY
jgi:L-cysteine desulfidase